MKNSFVCLVIAMFCVATVYSCTHDRDCRTDECCIEYVPYVKRCSNKPNDPGERCGGQFICSCLGELQCVSDPPSIYKYFKLGTGTCKSKTAA